MMNSDDYRHFVCITAGENPDEMMQEFDKSKKGEKKLIYKYSDAKSIKEKFIKAYSTLLSRETNNFKKEYIKSTIQDFSEMDNDEFFDYIAKSQGLTIEEETGDAYSDGSDNGKWSSYSIGKLFSIPFLLNDGREVYQARKKDIDWEHVHLSGGDIYRRAWEMVVDGDAPQTPYEEVIYNNMKDKRAYFDKFETVDNYVTSNTAFWGYAFLSKETGWVDATDEDQFAWMSNYYDRFIKGLPDDTLLTIYECSV